MIYFAVLYLRLIVFIFIGIFLANVVMELGLIKHLTRPLIPLAKVAKIPNEATVVPAVFMLDGTAAHSTLASLIDKGCVSESEAITTVLISSASRRIGTLLRYYLPVAVPALGFSLAIEYVAFSFVGSMLSIGIGFLYGRLVNEGTRPQEGFSPPDVRTSKKEAVKKSFVETLRLLRKIALRLGVTILVLIALIDFGAFDLLGEYMGPVLSSTGMSTQSIIVITTQLVSPSAGMVTAGEMFKEGMFTVKEILLTLFLGTILFVVVMDFPRNIMPIFASIYGVKFASKLATVELLTYVSATMFVMALIYFVL